MASLQAFFLHPPLIDSKPLFLRPWKICPPLLPKLPSINSRNSFFPHLARLSLKATALPTTELEFLEAVSQSEGSSLPCVRSYENDLARLTLVGAVDFEQALTAAAADGGEAASEHVDAGLPAMVAETVFPGTSGDRSTVSTRLFLPSIKVKEKSKKLRRSLTKDLLSSTTSRSILAMTFRQVILQQLWNFELMLFSPGTERDMEDLENPREVPASFTLSSSGGCVIPQLAEVVCIAALESTKRTFYNKSMGKASISFSRWFNRRERIASKDYSFVLYKLFEDEIVSDVQSLLDNFNSIKAKYKCVEKKLKYSWWTPSAFSKLEKIGGPGFSNWACEYLPAYRLQIDNNKLPNTKFKGWKKSAENRWEVLLTHSQMVNLANILDMYYEDQYTLPDKASSFGMTENFTSLSKSKGEFSLLKMLSVIVASGIFLVSINVVGLLCFPYLPKGRKSVTELSSLSSSEIDCPQLQYLDATMAEEFCTSIVQRIKDAFGWPGDIRSNVKVGAWTGKPPIYLTGTSVTEDVVTDSTSLETSKEGMTTSAQDIASYQVVLSSAGRIVGFRPTSQVAVNQWAANPLAKELYGGRKLSPGILEPGVKIQYPKEVVVLELLMSVNPNSWFALARPAQ